MGNTGSLNVASSPSSVKALVLPLPPVGEKKHLTIHTSKLPVSNPPNDVFSSNSASVAVEEGWNMVQSPDWVAPLSPSPSSPLSSKTTSAPLLPHLKKTETSPTQQKPELTDKDFPPLGPTKGEQKLGSGYWEDKRTTQIENEANVESVHLSIIINNG